MKRILYNQEPSDGGTAVEPVENAPPVTPDPPAVEPVQEDPPATPQLSDDLVFDNELAERHGLGKFAGKKMADILEAYKNAEKRAVKAEQKANAKAKPEAPANEGPDFSEAFAEYLESGEIDADASKAIAERVGVAPQDVADFFEFKKAKRQSLFEGAKEYTGDLDPQEVIAWVESGESPYDESVIAGFNRLFLDGDASWMAGVAKRYTAHIDSGGKRYGNGQAAQQSRPTMKGRPPQADAPGYKSWAESMDALRAAGNDPAKIKEYQAKLAQSRTDLWADRPR